MVCNNYFSVKVFELFAVAYLYAYCSRKLHKIDKTAE